MGLPNIVGVQYGLCRQEYCQFYSKKTPIFLCHLRVVRVLCGHCARTPPVSEMEDLKVSIVGHPYRGMAVGNIAKCNMGSEVPDHQLLPMRGAQ